MVPLVFHDGGALWIKTLGHGLAVGRLDPHVLDNVEATPTCGVRRHIDLGLPTDRSTDARTTSSGAPRSSNWITIMSSSGITAARRMAGPTSTPVAIDQATRSRGRAIESVMCWISSGARSTSAAMLADVHPVRGGRGQCKSAHTLQTKTKKDRRGKKARLATAASVSVASFFVCFRSTFFGSRGCGAARKKPPPPSNLRRPIKNGDSRWAGPLYQTKKKRKRAGQRARPPAAARTWSPPAFAPFAL
ncbi:hypothetical protein TW95_gp0071 [Pandoravirus inopinatum]|uniref:Uncharacterized protein n=1 Tax=Pandoravirus inopinatum TaxID=1605721 RepID=A0A0B5J596_9VIRU|nr:hypothetical protein TW95_gp0071 [Pandoravirus inopinatum]AJF96805.1 hypothetical protein [Pandoravirus inopinatum]